MRIDEVQAADGQRQGKPSGVPTETQPFEFTRLIAHWAGYADSGYLSFVEDAKPEIAQVGFYGAHFWSLADTPFGNGYPAHLPVRGHRECGEWFRRLNEHLHLRGVKVVGHLNVKFLVGDPDSAEGPRGFFRFYRDQWDEKTLGAKPVADPVDLLEKDKSGKPIANQNYSIGGMREYWACLNNPHWRQVLKAWVRSAIERGVDGLIANYFYRHDCHCSHCVMAFKSYLRERFTAEQLRLQFGITDLSAHAFEEIVAWHDPARSTPLRREMLRFSQIANKLAFDEVFRQFGRSLKSDLIVAQWNHLGDFNQINGDERCLLPDSMWSKGEDYLWYSTGDAANRTDLAAGILGEGTLQARFIRGASNDKPFTLGKYESVRIRAAIAELAANGGAPMGFYTAFEDAEARLEIMRYYGFLKRYESLYRGNRTAGEVLLLFPRSRVHAGEVASVGRFKEWGKRLLDAHVLFDVLPDDRLNSETRAGYDLVIHPSDESLDVAKVLGQVERLTSRFQAPTTVRVSASRPATGGELTLHFVNYNRAEPADKSQRGSGIKDEKPLAAPPFSASVRTGLNRRVRQVEFLTPEAKQASPLVFRQMQERVVFEVPEFLVYSLVRIHFSKAD